MILALLKPPVRVQMSHCQPMFENQGARVGKRGILGILMVLMVSVPSFSINSVVLREACPQQQLLVGFSPWQGMEK